MAPSKTLTSPTVKKGMAYGPTRQGKNMVRRQVGERSRPGMQGSLPRWKRPDRARCAGRHRARAIKKELAPARTSWSWSTSVSGYGAQSALIVECLTDNNNRTATAEDAQPFQRRAARRAGQQQFLFEHVGLARGTPPGYRRGHAKPPPATPARMSRALTHAQTTTFPRLSRRALITAAPPPPAPRKWLSPKTVRVVTSELG